MHTTRPVHLILFYLFILIIFPFTRFSQPSRYFLPLWHNHSPRQPAWRLKTAAMISGDCGFSSGSLENWSVSIVARYVDSVRHHRYLLISRDPSYGCSSVRERRWCGKRNYILIVLHHLISQLIVMADFTSDVTRQHCKILIHCWLYTVSVFKD